MNSKFDALVFDLDDTLLDTYRLLLPQASKEACQVMIESGLKAELADCLRARDEFAQVEGRAQLFEKLTSHFGVRAEVNIDHVASRGLRAFYDRRVESNIDLFSGAREMLCELKKRYAVHLVTSGHPNTQSEKLEILNLKPLFDSVAVVNTLANELKSQAFQKIQKQSGFAPDRFLSIGNRLDTDIAPAKRLGWSTCWVRYGEYARCTPANSFENADVVINNINQLATACQL